MAQSPRISRRQVLTLASASALVSATGCGTSESVGSNTSSSQAAFRHGVASGEPWPNSVVIWTRLTPEPAAVPGSGLGGPRTLSWEVASDAAFASVVKTGTVATAASSDHTANVVVDGLQAGRDYWYRFRLGALVSPVGRTRTAPATSATPTALRFGVATCAEWEFGFYSAYRHLADRDDIDAVIHMGDYIYEFGTSYGPAASPGAAFGRVHEPPHEIITLKDYRERYGQYRSDPDLQRLHAKHPFITMYDDHEVANDWYKSGAENHDAATEGDFFDRLAAALQAWREWQPLRTFSGTEPLRAWRKMQFGNLVDLWVLDTRLYRDQQPSNAIVGYGSVDPAINDPSRTLLGAEQKQWLKDGLTASTAGWKVLGNQVPFFPFVVGPALPSALLGVLDPVSGSLPPLPATLTVEDWNGYRAEQLEMYAHLEGVADVIVLTGDYHESFASEVPVRSGDYLLDGNSVAVEFICPSVTSPGLGDTLEAVGLPSGGGTLINGVFEANLALNPWVKYHEGFRNGYAVIEFATDAVQYDFWHISNREDAQATSAVGASWRVLKGSSTLVASATPLASKVRTSG